MKKAHWSISFGNMISIDIEYNNGSRRGWDYNCLQYPDLDSLKKNMSEDFSAPIDNVSNISFFITNGTNETSVEIPPTNLSGDRFTEYVFKMVRAMI